MPAQVPVQVQVQARRYGVMPTHLRVSPVRCCHVKWVPWWQAVPLAVAATATTRCRLDSRAGDNGRCSKGDNINHTNNNRPVVAIVVVTMPWVRQPQVLAVPRAGVVWR